LLVFEEVWASELLVFNSEVMDWQEVALVRERPAALDRIVYAEEINEEVLGVPVRVILETGDFSHRDWFNIKKLTLNLEHYPDAAQRLAEAVMRAHWYGWIADDSEAREEVSFEVFMERVKDGEDMSYQIGAADIDQGSFTPQPVQVDPRMPVRLVITDRSQPVVIGNAGANQSSVGYYIWDKGLVIMSRSPAPDKKYFWRAWEKYSYMRERVLSIRLSSNPTGAIFIELEFLSLSDYVQLHGGVSCGMRGWNEITSEGYITLPDGTLAYAKKADLWGLREDGICAEGEPCWGILRIEVEPPLPELESDS